MIESRVVLVLGAGASWDYGFPTGPLLKAKIWKILEDEEFQETTGSSIDFEHFRRSLELTPDLSIDAFLEHNFKEFGDVGKAAIARVLLPYEKEINLFGGWMQKTLDNEIPSYCDIPQAGQNWYSYLFNKMSEGCSFDEFQENKLTIVTFNYDRSFERFMLQALCAKYQKKIEEAEELINQIPIIHVYGQLGEKFSGEQDYNSWNELPRMTMRRVIKNAVKSIKIIHESGDLETLKKVQEAFKWAEKIFFLGFGYHMTNMKRLFQEIGNMPVGGLGLSGRNLLQEEPGMSILRSRCYGTAYGLSPHHRNALAEFGLNGIRQNISRNNTDKNYEDFPDSTVYEFLVYNHNAKL